MLEIIRSSEDIVCTQDIVLCELLKEVHCAWAVTEWD